MVEVGDGDSGTSLFESYIQAELERLRTEARARMLELWPKYPPLRRAAGLPRRTEGR